MNFFQKLFARPVAKPASAPAPPAQAPNWLEVDGQFVDLNTFTPAQLAQLEADLLARRQQRETELATYLQNLAAERERLLESRDPSLWVLTLKLMFGEELGRRVALQNVVAGMQLQHLIMSFGRPDRVDASGAVVKLAYGEPDTTSYFEVEGDTISRAVVGSAPPLPPGFWG